MPKPIRRNGARNPQRPAEEDELPFSTRAQDPPEFVERVQGEARRRLGRSLEEAIPEPHLREVLYNAIADGLRRELRPVAPAVTGLAERPAEHGMKLTPGSGDVRDLPTPMSIPGVSLGDAVIEERYGYREAMPDREASTTQAGNTKRPRTRSGRARGAGKPDPNAFTPEFRERLDAAARRAFGAPIEEIVPPGEVRDLLYQVFTKVLNRKPRPISPETMDLVERCRAAGLVVTPGAGPRYLRKPLKIKGLEGRSVLTDAILEERYGSDS